MSLAWGRSPRRDVPKVQWNFWDYGFLLIAACMGVVVIWSVAEIIWG